MSAIVNDKKPLVSFFLATYNRVDVVRETLQKLYEQTYRPIEIIVADNSSYDGTPEMIEKDFPDVKLIKLTRNHGAIAARNIACINTHGEYVVSIDDDSFPGLHCIERMVDRFEEDNNLGLISFRVFSYFRKVQYYNDENKLLENNNSLSEYQNNWSGCGGAYRRTIFNKFGFWDEWGREAPFELSVSVKSMFMGFYNKSFNDIYVFHQWSDVGEAAEYRISNLSDYTAARSMILFIIKYSPLDLSSLQKIMHIIWVSCLDIFSKKRLTLIKSLFSAFIASYKVVLNRIPLKSELFNEIKISTNFRGK